MQRPQTPATGSARSVGVGAIAPPPPAVRRNPAAPWPSSKEKGSVPYSKQGNRQAPPYMPFTSNRPAQHSPMVTGRRLGHQPDRAPVDARQQSTANPTGVAVTWLGTSSGSPTGHRNVSCTVVQVPGAVFLVDCGEGTHRQLQEANVDLAKVEGIFITHLHGDHCFGLPTALRLIDSAKAAAAAAARARSSHSPLSHSSSTSSSPSSGSDGAWGGDGWGSGGPEVPVTHVYGPPGLQELLRVALALTGEDQMLSTRIVVTELVLHPRDSDSSESDAGREEQGSSSGVDDEDSITEGRSQQVGAAQWDSRVMSSREDGGGVGSSSSSSSDYGGGGGPGLSNGKLLSRSLFHDARLKATAEAMREDIRSMPVIWRPPRAQPPGGRPQQQALTPQQAKEQQQQQQWRQHTAEYAGFNYVAAFGQYWELPCRKARVRAAQLQHRVPCWGYVFEEMLPAQEGRARQGRAPEGAPSLQEAGSEPEPGSSLQFGRKVVVLGDTIVSNPMAPLAYGCDVISHEATFMGGMEAKCRVGQHSTAYLAGAFAHCVQAKHLVLTHFSGRYSPAHQGGRGGGRPNTWRERPVDSEAEEAEQDEAICRLIQEARSNFDGPVSAAHDFFRVDVQQRTRASASGAGAGAGRPRI